MIRLAPSFATVLLFAAGSTTLAAQAAQIRVTPAKLTLKIGEEIQLEVQALDVGGRPVDAQIFFFSRDRRSVSVDRNGIVKAIKPGSFQIIARAGGRRRGGVTTIVPVTVAFPKPSAIDVSGSYVNDESLRRSFSIASRSASYCEASIG